MWLSTKDLSVCEWTCPECGVYHDRDVNAAVNILAEAKRIMNLSESVKKGQKESAEKGQKKSNKKGKHTNHTKVLSLIIIDKDLDLSLQAQNL